jgi:hypothetical protein
MHASFRVNGLPLLNSSAPPFNHFSKEAIRYQMLKMGAPML